MPGSGFRAGLRSWKQRLKARFFLGLYDGSIDLILSFIIGIRLLKK
jgi:hypothetical protein